MSEGTSEARSALSLGNECCTNAKFEDAPKTNHNISGAHIRPAEPTKTSFSSLEPSALPRIVVSVAPGSSHSKSRSIGGR